MSKESARSQRGEKAVISDLLLSMSIARWRDWRRESVANRDCGVGVAGAASTGGRFGALLEAELFGFETVAFTDARQSKRGLFGATHRRTIFLDELALLPRGLQGKVLRVVWYFFHPDHRLAGTIAATPRKR
jgi:hypothetical protein